jgi:pimeloyl-ACP methyl ester carboxylesterase
VKEVPLQIASDGNVLTGGAFVPNDATRSVVLLHGIPSISPPDPVDVGYPGLARRFAEDGWVAAWADMRAVRNSPGFFSVEGWVTDVASIVAAVRALHPTSFLALVGSSAGGAVSTEAVARGLDVDALALLASPAAWVSFAGDPAAGIARITGEAGMAVAPEVLEDPTAWAAEFDGVTTKDSIRKVTVPVLILHGDADDVVPVDHAGDIAAGASDAELHIIKGAAHQLRRDERALATLMRWLEGLSSAR